MAIVMAPPPELAGASPIPHEEVGAAGALVAGGAGSPEVELGELEVASEGVDGAGGADDAEGTGSALAEAEGTGSRGTGFVSARQ